MIQGAIICKTTFHNCLHMTSALQLHDKVIRLVMWKQSQKIKKTTTESAKANTVISSLFQSLLLKAKVSKCKRGCWDQWLSNGGSPCVTKLATWLSLSWKQSKSLEPQMSHNPSDVKTQQSPVVCNSEVIKAYEGSARSLVSQLLPLPPPPLSSVLPRNPSCGDAANCLRQPANKNSCFSLPHQSNASACNGITKILQDSRTAGVISPAVLPTGPSRAQQKLHTNVFVL